MTAVGDEMKDWACKQWCMRMCYVCHCMRFGLYTLVTPSSASSSFATPLFGIPFHPSSKAYILRMGALTFVLMKGFNTDQP